MTTPNSARRRAEGILLVLVLALAFWLRTRDVDSYYVGPDDGSYMHSAQLDVIEPGFRPLVWVREDVAWVRWLSAHYGEENVTYQHSYAHQFVARYLFRFGLGSLSALRTSSAITGTLTALFAWWLFARAFTARRSLGLLAAAIVAVAPMHVFYSRTGWGQIGFACFYLAYTAVLYRVLFVIPRDSARELRRAGWALCAFSLLAFGWQEGVAPFVVGSGLLVVLAQIAFVDAGDERTWIARVLSRRTWTYVWSAIPIGGCTLALALWSPFAQKYWFTVKGRAGLDSWTALKRLSATDLCTGQRFDLQIGWLVLALALVGFVAWWRTERRFVFHLCASALFGSAILFLAFGDAFLLRGYMPLFVTLLIGAATGTSEIARALATRAGHLAGAAFTGLVLISLLVVTWTTLFGRVEQALFVQRLYAHAEPRLVDYRNVDRPILDTLRSRMKPGDKVGVFADKAALFRLQDAGIRATEDYLEGPKDAWPAWVVGVSRIFDPSPHSATRGGEYQVAATDTIGRWSLYERIAR